MIGESALERRLARRVLAKPRGDDVAHDALVDDGGIDARAADRFGDDQRAELLRGDVFERAEKFACRRAHG